MTDGMTIAQHAYDVGYDEKSDDVDHGQNPMDRDAGHHDRRQCGLGNLRRSRRGAGRMNGVGRRGSVRHADDVLRELVDGEQVEEVRRPGLRWRIA